jgi:predicted permease
MKPPGIFVRLHLWILSRRLSPAWREFVQGDLEEEFGRRRARGELRARLWLSLQTASCIVWPPPATGSGRPSSRRGDGFMRSLAQDVRFTVRLLRKSPAFTATAVLTLALGLGANTSIFSIAYAGIIRPLPYAGPERLLIVRDLQGTNETNASFPEYRDWRERTAGVAETAAVIGTSFVAGGPDPMSVMGQRVSASLWRVLDLQPSLGRSFTEEEDLAAAERVAMIGYGLWQRRYGSDATVIGRTILLDDLDYRIVGVLPRGFRGVLPRDSSSASPREVWIPLRLTEQNAPRGLHLITVVARVRAGVSLDRAREQFGIAAAALQKDQRTRHGIVTHPLVEYVASGSRDVLLTLAAALAAVLLIASANLASLMLARTAGRRAEVAVRLAIGAPRWRIAQQCFLESVILAALGGALGLLVAYAGLRWFVASEPLTAFNTGLVHLNGPALIFTSAVALLTGVLVGSVPAWQAMRMSSDFLLNGPMRSGSGPHAGVRGVLVVTELAVAVVLLVSAGLLSQSLLRLVAVDKGFDGARLATFDLMLSRAMSREPALQARAFEEILTGLEQIPGVERAALVLSLPLAGGGVDGGVPIDGRTFPDGEQPVAEKQIVSAGYFAALRVPVLQGREFTAGDRQGSAPVAIVSEAFARRYLPGENPLGKRIEFAWGIQGTQEIVGVVGDVRANGFDVPPAPTIYVSYLQRPSSVFSLVVQSTRTPADLAPALREAIHRIDPTRPVPAVRAVDDVIGEVLEPRRVALTVVVGFAAVALALAVIGVYGVVNYATRSRTREIGLRIALGAQPRDVLALVMKHGFVLTGTGIALGIAGSAAAARLVQSHLFATSPLDPATIGGTVVILGLAALMATLLPARRAARLDPVRALRDQAGV